MIAHTNHPVSSERGGRGGRGMGRDKEEEREDGKFYIVPIHEHHNNQRCLMKLTNFKALTSPTNASTGRIL